MRPLRLAIVTIVLALAAAAAVVLAQAVILEDDPVVVAVGDIACDPGDEEFNGGLGSDSDCRHKHTSDLVVDEQPTAFLALGDLQYEDGELDKFQRSYDRTWGRVKEITRPVPGNHEYRSAGAAGYFDYFGDTAGERGKGYYSFDVGDWHLVALNSNCDEVGCGSGSPQLDWLRRDLAANSKRCTLAYWHHPRFTSSEVHDNDPAVEPFWEVLYEQGADLVVVGHAHNYERFAPQDPDGDEDAARGLRQFVVGTGGKSLYPFEEPKPNSEVRDAGAYGVLRLTLRESGYDWEFVPEEGEDFWDEGSADCH